MNERLVDVLFATAYFWIENKQCTTFEGTTLEVTFHRGGFLGRTDNISTYLSKLYNKEYNTLEARLKVLNAQN